jgi:hypothetical protein
MPPNRVMFGVGVAESSRWPLSGHRERVSAPCWAVTSRRAVGVEWGRCRGKRRPGENSGIAHLAGLRMAKVTTVNELTVVNKSITGGPVVGTTGRAELARGLLDHPGG